MGMMAALPHRGAARSRFSPPSFGSMIKDSSDRSTRAAHRGRRVRNRRRWVLRGLGWLLLAVESAVLWPTRLGGTIAYVAVSGDSMLPTLHPGDLVVTRSQGTYQVGDLIVYVVPR